MWYEILPCFSIMVGVMSLACATPYGLSDLCIGHKFLRQLIHASEINYYLRDERLTGSAYKPQGLECIPDEPSGSSSN